MTRHLLMDGAFVANIIELDDGATYAPPDGLTLLATERDDVGVGWTLTDADTWEPPTPEPLDLPTLRAAAILPRRDFVTAAFRAGILSAAEAPGAARGEWPASFAAMLTALPDGEQVEAQIEWAAATTIRYAHPLVQAAAAAHAAATGATVDAVLDGLFGIPSV